MKGIFLATRTHAFNLAKFVTIYKVFLLLQRKMNGGKERDLDSLIAGGLGGWWVFGERTAVGLVSHPCPLPKIFLTTSPPYCIGYHSLLERSRPLPAHPSRSLPLACSR